MEQPEQTLPSQQPADRQAPTVTASVQEEAGMAAGGPTPAAAAAGGQPTQHAPERRGGQAGGPGVGYVSPSQWYHSREAAAKVAKNKEMQVGFCV